MIDEGRTREQGREGRCSRRVWKCVSFARSACRSAQPSVPTNLAATPATGQVDLTWRSTDDVGRRHRLRRVPRREQDHHNAYRRHGTTCTDTTVTAGQTYNCGVEALGASGNRSGQTLRSAPPPPPDPSS